MSVMKNQDFGLSQKIWYVILLVFALVLFVFAPRAYWYQPNDIVISSQTLSGLAFSSDDHIDFYGQARWEVISSLIAQWFDKFEKTPYSPGVFPLHMQSSGSTEQYPEFYGTEVVSGDDALDDLLQTYFSGHREDVVDFFVNGRAVEFESFVISADVVQKFENIFLFKQASDLEKLWYVVSSFRRRKNTDPQYRRDNIYISYYNIWNTRVINPQETLSFMDEIHYDSGTPWDNLSLAYGFGQAGGVKVMYGGGICGGGFWFFWVSVVNKWIEVLERHNHTTRYRSLYNNELNGQDVWYPGLDTSVYDFGWSRKDFRIKNIRNYPIVLVINYDNSFGGVEEVFTLAKEEDRGSFSYLGKKGPCYVREFNGEAFKSCYSGLR